MSGLRGRASSEQARAGARTGTLDVSDTPPTRNKGGRPHAILPHEHPQIVALMATGWTQRQVADAIRVGVRTLQRHLARPDVKAAVAAERDAIRHSAEAALEREKARRQVETERHRAVERLLTNLRETAGLRSETPANPEPSPAAPPTTLREPAGPVVIGATVGRPGAITWETGGSDGPEVRTSIVARREQPAPTHGYGTPARRRKPWP